MAAQSPACEQICDRRAGDLRAAWPPTSSEPQVGGAISDIDRQQTSAVKQLQELGFAWPMAPGKGLMGQWRCRLRRRFGRTSQALLTGQYLWLRRARKGRHIPETNTPHQAGEPRGAGFHNVDGRCGASG